ncbi:hypothetical protein CW696_01225 [ANME-2 cluster archaeon]|nr:MAG: hypothetical protein CW696_01225 [ANME-2 cluster archaeon]
MNDLTTAFAVPKSEGNAGAEDVSKHSAVSRGEIAECGCEVAGWVGQVILSQSHVLDAIQDALGWDPFIPSGCAGE